MAFNRTNKVKTAVNVDDFVVSTIANIIEQNEVWSGTMTDLLNKLRNPKSKKINLPKSPSALRVVVNRVINRIRHRGVSVKFYRENDKARTRVVKFER